MCEYCKEYRKEEIAGDEFEMKKTSGYYDDRIKYSCWITKNIADKKAGIMVTNGGGNACYIDINYCPMCGRKLTK